MRHELVVGQHAQVWSRVLARLGSAGHRTETLGIGTTCRRGASASRWEVDVLDRSRRIASQRRRVAFVGFVGAPSVLAGLSAVHRGNAQHEPSLPAILAANIRMLAMAIVRFLVAERFIVLPV